MEVRDPVHGSIEITEGELRVIDSPFFQRLRNIKQMGFSDLAFPGATHTRYIHSIGAMLLAGQAFDSIFKNHAFKRPGLGRQFRSLVRLGALLHDVGHAPLSHCTEFAMPSISSLGIPAYHRHPPVTDRRATHEDYTIKIITDSSLTRVIERHFPDIAPLHVAGLVEQALPIEDDFFVDDGVNYRTVLAQIISSELDVDRMDYLRRDSYNAGVSYGNYDFNWIFTNLTFHVTDAGSAHLALDPRAIYTFNDFLIARYHMFLMVYFHHKSVIYEEMLKKYFQSPDASYAITADIDAYVEVDDYQLVHHLRQEAKAGQPWAKRLIDKDAYKLLHELHGRPEEIDLEPSVRALTRAGVTLIATSSTGDLSKYTKPGEKRRRGTAIYAAGKEPDGLRRRPQVRLLEECTDLFVKYEAQRQISRIYVPREEIERARDVLSSVSRD
jgi:hypothetical protein